VGRASRVRESRWSGAEEVIQPGLISEEGAMPPDDAPRPGEEELAEQTAAEEAAAEDGAGGDAPAEGGETAPEPAAEADVAPAEPEPDSEAAGDDDQQGS
jgi:hypothetical protein